MRNTPCSTPSPTPSSTARPSSRALIFAALEETDRTLAELERAADDSPDRTVALLSYPETAFLRDHPRLEQLRKRLNLR